VDRFTGQYDGDEQVYVIPRLAVCRGSLLTIRQRTVHAAWGWDNQVYGWTKDGKRIIFKSQRDSWSLPIAKLYTVSVDGGPAEALPMPEAGSGDYSPTAAAWFSRHSRATSVLRSVMAAARRIALHL
jgi:tricorn protease